MGVAGWGKPGGAQNHQSLHCTLASARSGLGCEERFPPPRLSSRCRFRKRSVAVGDWVDAGICVSSRSRTDRRRVRSMTDEEVHVGIDDPDAKPTDKAFWTNARVV